jgi:hypothetical protein
VRRSSHARVTMRSSSHNPSLHPSLAGLMVCAANSVPAEMRETGMLKGQECCEDGN